MRGDDPKATCRALTVTDGGGDLVAMVLSADGLVECDHGRPRHEQRPHKLDENSTTDEGEHQLAAWAQPMDDFAGVPAARS